MNFFSPKSSAAVIPKKRIAVLCLGGSISTYRDPKTGAIFSFDKENIVDFFPTIDTIEVEAYCQVIEKKFFLEPRDWGLAYKFIETKIDKFDGFIILQETDSLLFGAAMFSFLTAGLCKPIIFTSSPAPFGTNGAGNLAEKNILGALHFAASDLGETAVFNKGKLIRATRGKRRNVVDQSPFFSGQIDDLARIDEKGEIKMYIHRYRKNTPQKKFNLIPPSKTVIFLRMYPGYPTKCLDHLYSEHHIDALVIESLGYGSLHPDLIDRLESFHHAGVPVVVIAEHDSEKRRFSLDADQYKNLEKKTFLLVQNMTIWATIAKANICAENTDSPEEFYAMMKENMAGEIIEG